MIITLRTRFFTLWSLIPNQTVEFARSNGNTLCQATVRIVGTKWNFAKVEIIEIHMQWINPKVNIGDVLPLLPMSCTKP